MLALISCKLVDMTYLDTPFAGWLIVSPCRWVIYSLIVLGCVDL